MIKTTITKEKSLETCSQDAGHRQKKATRDPVQKKRKEKDYWAWEYSNTNDSPNIGSLAIELHIWLKYKRVVYTNCILVLNTNEIEFIWE